MTETQRDHGIRVHHPCTVSSNHNQAEGAGMSVAGLQSSTSPAHDLWTVPLWQQLLFITHHIKLLNELQWFHNVFWKQKKQLFLHHLKHF